MRPTFDQDMVNVFGRLFGAGVWVDSCSREGAEGGEWGGAGGRGGVNDTVNTIHTYVGGVWVFVSV